MWKLNQCLKCKHLNESEKNCKAFSKGIPNNIWEERIRHDLIQANQEEPLIYEPASPFLLKLDNLEKENIAASKHELEIFFLNLMEEQFGAIVIPKPRQLPKQSKIEYIIVPYQQDEIRIITRFNFIIPSKISRFIFRPNLFFRPSRSRIKFLENKLAQLHTLYNTPIWRGNKLILTLNLGSKLQVEILNGLYDYGLSNKPVGYLSKYKSISKYEEDIAKLETEEKEEKERIKNLKQISSEMAKYLIKQLIKTEDKTKPYSDEKMKNLIISKGYKIHRRDVAKYREEIGLKVARFRKQKYLEND